MNGEEWGGEAAGSEKSPKKRGEGPEMERGEGRGGWWRQGSTVKGKRERGRENRLDEKIIGGSREKVDDALIGG